MTDQLIVSDGATLISTGRIQVGWLGDGEMIVKDGAKIVHYGTGASPNQNNTVNFVVGDSRNSFNAGNGRVVFDNSTGNELRSITVSYCADGEMLLTNGSVITSFTGLFVCENSSAASTKGTITIEKGSKLQTTDIYLGQKASSTATINLNNGTLTGGHLWSGGNNTQSTINMVSSTLSVGDVNLTNLGSGPSTINLGGNNTVKFASLANVSNAKFNYFASSTGLANIAVTGVADFGSIIDVGLSYAATVIPDSSYTLATVGGTLTFTSGASNLFDVAAAGQTITATLKSGLEFTGAASATGWYNPGVLEKDEQGMHTVTLSLSGVTEANRESLLEAINSGNMALYSGNKYSWDAAGNLVSAEYVNNGGKTGLNVWDFSTLDGSLGTIQVTGVNWGDQAAYDQVVEMPVSTTNYNNFISQDQAVSHQVPVQLSGAGYSLSNTVQVYGHTALVDGAATTVAAKTTDFAIRIGGTGSSFDGDLDQLIISGGATVNASGRVLVGDKGDGELRITDSTLNLSGGNACHLMIGDARAATGLGNGRMIADNSTITVAGSLGVGYMANGKLDLLNGSSLTVGGNFKISENSGLSSTITGMIYVDSTSGITINGGSQTLIADNQNAVSDLNLDGGSFASNNTGNFNIGVYAGSRGQVNIGNGTNFSAVHQVQVGSASNTGIGKLNIVGGENTLLLNNGLLVGNGNSESSVNFYADNTGLSNLQVKGTASNFNGKLTVGQAGGMVAMDSKQFQIVSALDGSSFSNAPTSGNDDLWTLAADAGNTTLTASLNEAMKLDGSGQVKGWVELKADPDSGSLDNLAATLKISGVTNSQSLVDWLNEGSYLPDTALLETDLTVASYDPAKDVYSLSNLNFDEAGTTFLVFDLTGYNNDYLATASVLSASLGESDKSVPEPSSWLLLSAGLLGLYACRRKRQN